MSFIPILSNSDFTIFAVTLGLTILVLKYVMTKNKNTSRTPSQKRSFEFQLTGLPSANTDKVIAPMTATKVARPLQTQDQALSNHRVTFGVFTQIYSLTVLERSISQSPASTLAVQRVSGIDLSHQDLRGVRLRDKDLSGADLSHCNLIRANLSRKDLRGSSLAYADLTNAILVDADLTNVDCTGTRFHGANLQGAKLCDANLTNARFGPRRQLASKIYSDKNDQCASSQLIDIPGANLRQADFTSATLVNSDVARRLQEIDQYWTTWICPTDMRIGV